MIFQQTLLFAEPGCKGVMPRTRMKNSPQEHHGIARQRSELMKELIEQIARVLVDKPNSLLNTALDRLRPVKGSE